MQDKKIKLAMVQMGAAEGNAEYNMNKIRSIIRPPCHEASPSVDKSKACRLNPDFLTLISSTISL